MTLDDLEEKYGYYWSDEVLLQVKKILPEQRDLALEWIKSLGTYESGLTEFNEVFSLLQDLDPNMALEFALSHNFSLNQEQIAWVISHPEIKEHRQPENKQIKEILEQKYIDDDELFDEAYSGLSGQDALRKISQVAIPLGRKIFDKYKKDILKRFSVAGQDESRYIKEIIDLGILDEKEFKRAIKRMIKQASGSIPMSSVINSEFYSKEEIIEIAEEKGLTGITVDETFPEYFIDYMVEKLAEDNSYKIGEMFKRKVLNQKQRMTAIKLIENNKIGEYYKYFSQEEREVSRELFKNKKDGVSLSSDEIDLISKDDLNLALDLLRESIKTSYGSVRFLESEIIPGELVYEIFEKNKKDNALPVATKGLDKLKEAGLDVKFAKEALVSANKKELKKISSLLIEYIPEEERIKIEENYVKSVSGAIDYFKERGKNPKIRKKALARIASSTDALIQVISRGEEDLLDVDELEKLITYSKTKEILFSRDGKNILNKILDQISDEALNSFFKVDCLVFWDDQYISRVSNDKIVHATRDIMGRGTSRLLVQIENQIVADTYIKFMDKEHKEFLLGENPESFVAKEYIGKLKNKNKEIPTKYQFAYKEEVDDKDYDYALKYLKSKEEEFPTSYIQSNLNLFFSKWSGAKKSTLMNAYIQGLGDFNLGLIEDISEHRDTVLDEFYKLSQDHMKTILIDNYNDYKFAELTEKEIEPFSKVISQNKELLSYVVSNWADERIKLVLPFDQLVRMILEGEIDPKNIPEDIGERLALQAVRQQNLTLMSLVIKSAGLERLCQEVSNVEEARMILRMSQGERGRSYRGYGSYRYDQRGLIFQYLPKLNLAEEISEYIFDNSRNFGRNDTKPSENFREYEGRFNPEIIDRVLSQVSVKAEIKRIVDVLISQGFEKEVYSAMLSEPNKYEDIFPKSFIKQIYTPEVLNSILEGSPSNSDLSLVLNCNPDISIQNKAIEKALTLKYCQVTQNEDILVGRVSRFEIFKYDIDSKTLHIELGDDNLKESVLEFLSVYIELINTSGVLDFSTKIIVKSDGKEFDLSNYNVRYESEKEDKLQEVFGLINFGVPVKARARIFLSSYSDIICRVDFDEEDDSKPENTEIFDKIMAKIEKKSEELETDFLEILGSISKDHPFGVEMEFSSKIKRETIANKLNKAAEEGTIDGDFNAEGINNYVTTTGTNWEIKADGSIKTDDTRRFSAEVVSPKLYGEEGLAQLEQVVSQLASMGKKLETGIEYGCGVHVHHDLSEILNKEKDLTDIAKAFYSIQEPLYAVCNRNRSDDNYCSKLAFSDRGINTEGRGGFNLRTSHGTIEFRMKEGDVDPKSIVRWVRLTKATVDEVRSLYKENTIKMKRSIREGFSNIFEAIIIEKSLQYQKDKGINSMDPKETQKALMMSQMLLGELNV